MRRSPFWLAPTTVPGDTIASAERGLMLAALADSIRTILGRGSSSWRHEELGSLMSDDRSRPFAFESICDALGIDPSYLRRRVLSAARELPFPDRHAGALGTRPPWRAASLRA